jgi:hypothetical protein
MLSRRLLNKHTVSALVKTNTLRATNSQINFKYYAKNAMVQKIKVANPGMFVMNWNTNG